MREIKFRGKRIDNDKWVYGYLFYDFDCTDKYSPFITWKDDSYLGGTGEEQVEPEGISQYTGLKDKNDVEIYEGDIIDFSYDMFVGNFDTFIAKGVVVFEEGAFYVDLFENERTTEDEAYLLYSINLDELEVIGNIYENKELLEVENEK